MSVSNTPGVLVAVEGIDGAGKTTQIRRLEAWLGDRGIAFVSSKEPTDGPWGAKIRHSAVAGRMSPEDELAAFVEDRREHVANLVEPALAAGKVVLIDRYFLSTVAYQGARGLAPERLLRENAFAPTPDILVILDIEPSLGLRRVQQRGDRADLFEREDELQKAREIFLALNMPNQHILDGSKDPSEITAAIVALLSEALER